MGFNNTLRLKIAIVPKATQSNKKENQLGREIDADIKVAQI